MNLSFSKRAVQNARLSEVLSYASRAEWEERILREQNITAEKRTAEAGKVRKQGPWFLLERFLRQAGLRCSPAVLIAISLALGLGLSLLSGRFLSLPLVFLSVLIGLISPFYLLERRVNKRVAEFAADYPSMLHATGASLKVGLTPYQALERAVALLPEHSSLRREIEKLLLAINSGVRREQALAEFASDIRLPDIELFRSALLIVLENGGRLAPTLLRLATVSNSRLSLIKQAGVSTSSMRLTANVLLVVAPLLLLLLSARIPSYWSILLENETANFTASLGLALILGSDLLLRYLSNFKP